MQKKNARTVLVGAINLICLKDLVTKWSVMLISEVMKVTLQVQQKMGVSRMTKEMLTRDIKEIIERHLKGMVNDIEFKLLLSIDNYADIICKTYADELFKCFSPLITMKLEEFEE